MQCMQIKKMNNRRKIPNYIWIYFVFLSICTTFELRSKILTLEKTQIKFGFLLT